MELVIPPFIPPLLFVLVFTSPLIISKESLSVDAVLLAKSKPAPNSIPFTPPIEKTAFASFPSTDENPGSPRPTGRPTI